MNGLPYEPHIALDRLFAVDETPEQDAILFGEMIGEFPRDNVVVKSHSDSRSSSYPLRMHSSRKRTRPPVPALRGDMVGPRSTG